MIEYKLFICFFFLFINSSGINVEIINFFSFRLFLKHKIDLNNDEENKKKSLPAYCLFQKNLIMSELMPPMLFFFKNIGY